MELQGLIVFVAFALELSGLLWAVRRFGWLPCPTVILFLILGYQIVLIGIHEGIINYYFLTTFTRGGVISLFYTTLYIYAFMAAYAVISHVGLSHGAPTKHGTRIDLYFSSKAFFWINFSSFVGLVALCAIFAGSIRWNIAIENSTYLAMTNPDLILESGAFRTITLFPLLISCYSAVLAAINLRRNSLVSSLTFLVIGCLALLYLMGAHSRAAAAAPITFLVVSNVIAGRPKLIFTVGIMSVTIYLIWAAIMGRMQNTHGLVTIMSSASNLPGTDSPLLDILVPNIFEGAFSVAESLTLHAAFPESYKILSMLPTPSLLDGFDQIRDLFQVRLSPYAPMSGYVEVYLFGPGYVIALMAIATIAVRMNFSIQSRSRLLFLFGNIMLLLGFYTLNTYPARNGLKWFWFSIFLSLIGLASSWPKKMKLSANASRLAVRSSHN